MASREVGRVLRFDSRTCIVVVEETKKRYSCVLPGKFRTQGIRPIAGDIVEFAPLGSSDGIVRAIRNRKNELSRPKVANIDQVILVTSMKHPRVPLNIVDRFLVLTEREGIETIIVVNKVDLLEDCAELGAFEGIYGRLYIVLKVSAKTGKNLCTLQRVFQGKVSAVAGMSGVGKSSILNALNPGLGLRVAEISKKLERGKHTTSAMELLEFSFGGYVADTPGFASLDLKDIGFAELKKYFPEMKNIHESCAFNDCLHYQEPDCSVRKMVESGELSASRYESYKSMLVELRDQDSFRNRR